MNSPIRVASVVLALLALPASALALTLADTLAFEVPSPGLVGWYHFPDSTCFLDSSVVHSGRHAARIERDSKASGGFSALSMSLPIGFSGDTIEIRGWLRTSDVKGFAGLWLREDGIAGIVQFDNMQSRSLGGTTPWTEYRIALPLDKRAKTILFGALLGGAGTVHVDDLRLLVDGRPLAQAPALVRPLTVIDTDHEFDAGSKITASSLTSIQVDNLVLLGKVWGFLKYHHPRVTAGKLHWDYELFRVMPGVLAASSRDEAQARVIAWVDSIGVPNSCAPCASLPDSNLHLRPRTDWIRDRQLLGADLSDRLGRIYKNRSASDEKFFLSFVAGVKNPDFSNEAAFATPAYPDAGYRLLALYRFWNIIEYWFPYRDLIKENWDGVLREFVPQFATTSDQLAYRLAALALVSRVRDGHAVVASIGVSGARPPRGPCRLPVTLRSIGSRYVIDGYYDSLLAKASPLKVGDAILKLDGHSVDSLTKTWTPYYGVSNETSLRFELARAMAKGDCGPCRVEVERGGKTLELLAARDSSWRGSRAGTTHDRPGPAFQKLHENVAYLKLSAVSTNDIPSYLEQAAKTKCFVIDIRNYPREFVPFALGSHLVSRTTPFARFTCGDPSNPGAFLWTPSVEIEPAAPYYKGKVAVLVDETSISQSEYTAMAFRACGALVVGSTTAGADGNVSSVMLPGNLQASISGIGVFYPDQRPTQQIGIVPDLVVRPTIEGLIAGRDEVLEAAITKVLGRPVALSKP